MRTFILTAIIAASISSCTTASFIQHTPTLANTGQHTGKDQFTGRALYSTGTSTTSSNKNTQGASPYQSVNGVQLQGSYSVSKSLAIQSSFMHSAEKGGSETGGSKTIVYNYNRNIAEFGLAYFNSISGSENFYGEVGVGAGIGSYKATENPSGLAPGGRFYNHNVSKIYIQPSIYYVSPNVHIAGGLKFSFLSFTSIKSDYSSDERITRSLPTGDKLSTNTLDYFVKAEFFTNNVPWLGISTQMLFSTDLQRKFNSRQNDNNYGVGLCFHFGDMNKSSKKK